MFSRRRSDRLIWDVGHQAYPHKILTGRRDRIRTLRQGGGLSGFTKRDESEYDPFGAAHSSTSISAGLGMAVARDLDGGDNHVIAVIGDGAMSAGMAYEAMNNAGRHGYPPDRHPERQRHVDRAAGGRDERLSVAAALLASLSVAARYRQGRWPRAFPRRIEMAAKPGGGIRPRHGHRRPPCSRSWASTMSARSTAIISTMLLPVLQNVRDAWQKARSWSMW